MIHALVEYGAFITLLLSLFVVSGGVFVAGDIQATPRNNTLFLAAGAVLASLIGTTGAAMLLVRPLLNTNRERKHKVHTVVFTILVVANCGGLLTPLGDPPLFLGLLRGRAVPLDAEALPRVALRERDAPRHLLRASTAPPSGTRRCPTSCATRPR